MIVGLGLGIAASSHFVVSAAAEVIRVKKGVVAYGNAQVDTAQSKFGGASALFDGTGDYLYVLENIQIAAANADYTIEMWIRWNSLTGIQAITSDRPPTSAGYTSTNFYLEKSGANNFYFGYSGGGDITNTSTITTGTWYHLAVVRNSNVTQIYLNGTATGSTLSYTGVVGDGTLNIGANVGYYHNGWIDEFRISNTARYTANFTPSTTPFVNDENTLLLLHMDGTDGSTYFEDDNGVRAKKGVIAVDNAQIDTAQSKFGGASLLLDGTSDYLNTDVTYFGQNNFTAECWVRWYNAPGGGTRDTIMTNRSSVSSVNNGSWDFGHFDGTFYLTLKNTAGTLSQTGVAIQSGSTWYHFALVRNGTNVTLYRNGTSLISTTVAAGSDFGTTNSLTIGNYRDGTTQSIDAHIDELRISNTARYTSAFTAPTAPFVNDANTLLLIHADGTDGSTYFEDDNGVPGGHAEVSLTVSGNTKYSSTVAKYGDTSIYFDGANDKLTVTGNYSQPGDFTHELWFYPTSLSGDRCLMTIGNEATGRQNLYTSGNDLKLDGYSTSGVDILPNNTVNLNEWNHAAVTRSGSTVTLWLNGVSQGTGTYSSTYGNSTNAYIGALSDDAIDFVGYMDDIRLSRGARYTTTFTPSTTRLVDDANTIFLIQGGGANDSQAIRDTGSRVKKGVTAIGNAQVDTAQSKFGGSSANFDGSGDSLLTSTTEKFNLGTNDFTFEGWVRTTSLAANQIFLDFREASSSTVVPLLQIDTEGRLNYYVYPNYAIQSNTGVIAVNTWYHFALVRNSGVSKLYLNGTQVGSDYTDTADYGSRYLRLGKHATLTNGLFGWLDEVRISNTARYTANFTPSTTPFQNDSNTLLLLHMDGTDGSTVFTDDNGVPPDYDYGA